jgi:hypothetical protein
VLGSLSEVVKGLYLSVLAAAIFNCEHTENKATSKITNQQRIWCPLLLAVSLHNYGMAFNKPFKKVRKLLTL